MSLTDQEYWEKGYKDTPPDNAAGGNRKSVYRHIADLAKKLLGKKVMLMAAPYDDYLLFDVVLKKCLGDVGNGASIIEIGCAPGSHVMKIAGAFDLTPYGVEYAPSGAKICKANFELRGYDPSNVHLADFLSEEFQSKHFGKYAVVVSRGFIEHFENPEDVVKAHLALLKPGGHLVVSIPNLRGIYWLWTYIFNKPQLPLHNLDIMRLPKFQKLFDTGELQGQWCGYIGTFSFWLFTVKNPGVILRFILRTLIVIQMILNVVFRLIFKDKGLETSWFSPNLLYVGKKCA